MPAHAFREFDSGDDTPLDLQLDLLVDGELPEPQRRAVLLAMERSGNASWRQLALRFLERQTERQSVRQLMAGGNLVPVEFLPRRTGRHILARIGLVPLMATAAGLLIAVASATITLYAMRQASPNAPSGAAQAEVRAVLPPAVTYSSVSVPITVPMVRSTNTQDAMVVPVINETDGVPVKRTLIIQSDGDGFIMIPVSTSRTKVY